MQDYDIAYDFAVKAYKQFKNIIKSIALFGSVSKGTQNKESDIDLIIIIDDAYVKWDLELVSWYREELAKLVEKQKHGKRIHINTVTLTTFWERLINGEPVVINVLRYAQPLIDPGDFFSPLKALLINGRIRPTKESINTVIKRAPLHINRSKYNILKAMEDLYWAMVDSAHGALMSARQTPPSPEHIPEMLDSIFVNKGLLETKYVDWFKEMYAIAHHLSAGNIVDVSGKHIQMYRERTEDFVNQMTYLIREIEKRINNN